MVLYLSIGTAPTWPVTTFIQTCLSGQQRGTWYFLPPILRVPLEWSGSFHEMENQVRELTSDSAPLLMAFACPEGSVTWQSKRIYSPKKSFLERNEAFTCLLVSLPLMVWKWCTRLAGLPPTSNLAVEIIAQCVLFFWLKYRKNNCTLYFIC